MGQADIHRFETLRLEPSGDLCWIVLDRPHVLNAMSVRMRHEMFEAVQHVAAGPWRVMAMRGEGRAFSAGADLKDFPRQVDTGDRDAVRQAVEGWHRVVRAIRAMPQVSIAAVHGPTYGGGANLALAADIVVAGESLRMSQSYVNIGAGVDLGGTWILPRLVGLATARRLLLTGEVVDSGYAVAIGLVSEAVPDEFLVARVEELAGELAGKDPDVLRAIRSTIDRGTGATLDEHLDDEAEEVATTVGRSAFRSGTSRFWE